MTFKMINNTLLYLAIILSVLAIYFDYFLLYLLWAISILVGVSVMAIKDRNTKKVFIWIILIILSLMLIYYVIFIH